MIFAHLKEEASWASTNVSVFPNSHTQQTADTDVKPTISSRTSITKLVKGWEDNLVSIFDLTESSHRIPNTGSSDFQFPHQIPNLNI